MSKRQLIDEIRSVNRTALPEFLAKFDERDLTDYLQNLLRSRTPRPWGSSARGQYLTAHKPMMDTPARATLAVTATAVATLPAGDADDFDDDPWLDETFEAAAPVAIAASNTATTPASDKWLF